MPDFSHFSNSLASSLEFNSFVKTKFQGLYGRVDLCFPILCS